MVHLDTLESIVAHAPAVIHRHISIIMFVRGILIAHRHGNRLHDSGVDGSLELYRAGKACGVAAQVSELSEARHQSHACDNVAGAEFSFRAVGFGNLGVVPLVVVVCEQIVSGVESSCLSAVLVVAQIQVLWSAFYDDGFSCELIYAFQPGAFERLLLHIAILVKQLRLLGVRASVDEQRLELLDACNLLCDHASHSQLRGFCAPQSAGIVAGVDIQHTLVGGEMLVRESHALLRHCILLGQLIHILGRVDRVEIAFALHSVHFHVDSL